MKLPITHLFPRLAWLLLTAAAPLAAPAQESRYGEWRAPDTQLQQLVDELQAVVDEGRKARAGHPAFLDDLQAIVDRYRPPRRKVSISDRFDDADFTRDPTWEVLEGKFDITGRGLWLRTLLPVEPPATDNSGRQRDQTAELVFGLINELARGKESRDQAPATRVDRHVIRTSAAIASDFTLQFQLRSRRSRWGTLQFGIHQERKQRSGYQLVYQAAGRPLQLLVMHRGRPQLLAEADTSQLDLDDDRSHAVTWSRDRHGQMTVAVDHRELLRVVDRSYRDPFAGLVVTNTGGHYWLDDILVDSELR